MTGCAQEGVPQDLHLPRMAEQWRGFALLHVPFIKPSSSSMFRTRLWNFATSNEFSSVAFKASHFSVCSHFANVDMILLSNFTLQVPQDLPPLTKSKLISPCDVHELPASSFGFIGILIPFTRTETITQSWCDPSGTRPTWQVFLETRRWNLFQKGDAQRFAVIHRNSLVTFGTEPARL